MTESDLLLPLRIPEIGPSLGKLVVGAPGGPAGAALNVARYQLVTKMIESAGEARRLATNGERAAALSSLGRTAWLEAWEEAVGVVSGSLVQRINEALGVQAHAARVTRRHARRYLLGESESRELTARLGSAGACLVSALDELDRHAAAALNASGLQRDALESWQRSLLTSARRLESAWLLLHDAVTAELARGEQLRQALSRWRKPIWPVVAIGIPCIAMAVWSGLVFGGYVPAPAWLAFLWTRLF